MTMRKLDEQERTMCKKAIKRLTADKEYQEYQLEYNQLMLDKGLEQNLIRTRKQFIKEKSMNVSELESINRNIEILRTQIKDGVEVKKPKETEKEKEEE